MPENRRALGAPRSPLQGSGEKLQAASIGRTMEEALVAVPDQIPPILGAAEDILSYLFTAGLIPAQQLTEGGAAHWIDASEQGIPVVATSKAWGDHAGTARLGWPARD